MDIIKELGLNVYYTLMRQSLVKPDIRYEDVVLVSDLRAAIDKLTVVYGILDQNGVMTIGSTKEAGSDTHKARLIGVEKLVKEPVRVEMLGNVSKSNYTQVFHDMDNHMHKFFGKRVRVIVEEVIE